MTDPKYSAPDIERAVLGSILLYEEFREKLFRELNLVDFTTYRPVYETIKFLWREEGELEEFEISDILRSKGYQELSYEVPKLIKEASANIDRLIKILKRKGNKRRQLHLAQKLKVNIEEGEPISDILKNIKELEVNGLQSKDWFNPVNPFEAEVKPLEWKVEGFLAKGMITLLGGEAGSGKSILTQYLLQLRNNQDLIEAYPGKAIFLTGMDSSETEIRRRAKSIGKGEGLFTVEMPDDIIPFATNEEFMNKLKEKIIDNKIDVIVFDTLADFHEGNLYEASDANSTMKAFRLLANSTGIAILLITHTRKSADSKTKYSVNDIADSRIFGTKSDFIFAIRSEYLESANLIELQCLKSRSPRPMAPLRALIEFDDITGVLNIEKSLKPFTSEAKEIKEERRIKERQKKAWELKQQGKSNREIAEKLDVTHPTVAKDLRRYEKENNTIGK